MPEFIIEMVCEGEARHRSLLSIGGLDVDREYANRLAGMLDGTSDFYVYPPREHPTPGSMLARCELCRAWFRATVKES